MTIPSQFFSRAEFACKCGCGYDTVDAELLSVLVQQRLYWGRPLYINSGCRCAKHNKKSGGSKKSLHLLGRAADFWIEGVAADAVADRLEARYPRKFGIGRYKGRTHLDTRSGPKARWDER